MLKDPWKVNPTIVYAQTALPTEVSKSIFLAGPTPRGGIPATWRIEAIDILTSLGFDGHIFVPEAEDSAWNGNYEAQIEWEEAALEMADQIVFWVPRDPNGEHGVKLPAFTTNIEWGRWEGSGKVVWGSPAKAPHTSYPKYYAKKLGVPVASSLKEALEIAVAKIGKGAPRQGGECQVPLHIWTKPEFQSWYKAQGDAGNRLDGAKVLWSFQPKPNFTFCYTLKVDVHIGSENRNKINEFVFTRPDISAVVLWSGHAYSKEIVLVREFRSPVRNDDGFVYELPGGSSINPGEDPLEIAAAEVEEETGLRIDPKRFQLQGVRQMGATLLSHTCTLFSCQLTEHEIETLKADKSAHGNLADSERTFVEVVPIMQLQKVDWPTLGMIWSCFV